MPQSPQFVHLHVHSAYSLAEGAIRTKDLVKWCQNYKMPAVAVTDTNNLFGALEFAMAASQSGVQPIIGCQMRLGIEKHELVILVQTEQGYRNLCKLVSDSFLETDPTETAHVSWEQLKGHTDGLICLTGGLRGPIGQYLIHNQAKQAEGCLKKLKKLFSDRLYIELQRHNVVEEDRIEESFIDLAYKHDVPLVATNDCYFATRDMHKAHDALLCIADGRFVTEDNRRRETPEHYFKSSDEMIELFKDIPEAIENTSLIAQRCSFLLTPIDPILPPFDTVGGRSEVEELKAQSKAGLEWRLENFVLDEGLSQKEKDDISKPYFDRLDYELEVIEGMGFPGYFLIVSDFIKWAKDENIPVGPGRGSGAGSVVAWALKITDLDPLELGLLFERFLNPERVSMPDFDVDFCQDRRDEVIRYVQEKYGHDHVAQIITFGKLQARAVVRDVGRVLQLPYGQVDRIAKMIPNNPAAPTTLQEALDQDRDLRNEVAKEEATEVLIDIALKLEGLYRHASTHAAGVVIGDRPLHELVPLYRDPRSDMPVTQFNMKYVEQAGLVKFDFLGLKTMTVIQKAVEMVNDTHGDDTVEILKVPLDDTKSYELMAQAQTTGVFQLESSGMRDTLRRMKPDRLEDIIALVSLYRPGPMDNIPKYCAIKDGREEADYMHPKLQPYLEETYGIMIYQEQVMQAAQALSGYSLGAADLLRRAMGKKIQAEMDAQREIFMKGAAEHNDVPDEQSSHIFDQIAKFAGYGFNKSHAAAYALIAYWTAWLKANYPTQFMAASMTLDYGNTEKLAIFKQGLDRMGIELLPPDINKSEAMFAVEGEGVRYALAALKGVGEQAMHNLVAERKANGPFKSLQDMTSRLDPGTLNKRQFEQLAAAGAFDELESNRAKVYGAAELLLRDAQDKAAEREAGQSNLFGGAAPEEMQRLDLPEAKLWGMLEQLKHEFDAIGFYLSAHPLDIKQEQFAQMNITAFADVEDKMNYKSSTMIDMAGVLLKKQIRVSSKSGKKFAFLQLSDSSGVYEVTLFSETLNMIKDHLVEGEAFLFKTIAEKNEDQIRFTVQKIDPMDKALAARIKQVQIYLDNEKPLSQLKTLLDTEGKGALQIRLFYNYQDNIEVEMELPGLRSFSPSARDALLTAEGIRDIQEL